MREGKRPPRLLRWLTRIYPAAFRDRYQDEMLEVLEDDHSSRRGRRERAAFWWRSIRGVLRTAPREHFADLGQETGQVLRSMFRRPLAVIVSVLSMGIAIGATATIFATLSSLFFHPVPGVSDSERLVNIKPYSERQEATESASYPDYLEMVDGIKGLEGLSAFSGRGFSVRASVNDLPELSLVQVTTSNYLEVVGAKPSRGRYFSDAEMESGALVAFVSEWFYRNRLGSPADLPQIFVNGIRFDIVGVGTEGFRGIFKGFPSDVYLPLGVESALSLPSRTDRSVRFLELVGKRKPEVSLQSLTAETEAFGRTLASNFPKINDDLSLQVEANVGLDADLRRGLLIFLSTLVVLCLLILGIAVLNVASMMSGRSLERREDNAVRLALGAPLHRLARRILIETSVLGVLSSAAGGLLLLALVPRVTSAFQAIDNRLMVDVRVTTEVQVALMVMAALVALVAALTSAPGVSLGKVNSASRGRIGGGARWRKAMVVGQVVLSFVVLAVAGFFVRALQSASEIEIGFDPGPVVTSTLNPSLVQMGDGEGDAFLQRMKEDVAALGAVESAALANRIPLSLGARFFPNRATVAVPGWQPPEGSDGFAIEHAVVSRDYFETMSIEIVDGRPFDARDIWDEVEAAEAPADRTQAADGVAEDRKRLSVVVNEEFADRFFPDGALAKELVVDQRPALVVGVAETTKVRTLNEEPAPHLYLAFEQIRPSRAVLLARSQGQPSEVVADVRAIQRNLAPELPEDELAPLEDVLSSAILPQRVGAFIAGSLGLFGALLSMVGLYGVLAQWVASRRQEVGLRATLGAAPAGIVALVLRQGAFLTLVGVALGLPLALIAGSLAKSLLYGMGPLDLAVYLVLVAAFAVATLTACLVPALRALRVSPQEALRAE